MSRSPSSTGLPNGRTCGILRTWHQAGLCCWSCRSPSGVWQGVAGQGTRRLLSALQAPPVCAAAVVHWPGRPQAPHGAAQPPLGRQVLLANPMGQCTPHHLVNGRAPLVGLESRRVEPASARLGNLDVAAAEHRTQGRPRVMRLLLLLHGHTLPCAAGAICTRFSQPPPCHPSCPKPHLACSDSPLL